MNDKTREDAAVLKPCPFCGDKTSLMCGTTTWGTPRISCLNCLLTMDQADDETWNTRATDTLCPNVYTSKGGTSYCTLAANDKRDALLREVGECLRDSQRELGRHYMAMGIINKMIETLKAEGY